MCGRVVSTLNIYGVANCKIFAQDTNDNDNFIITLFINLKRFKNKYFKSTSSSNDRIFNLTINC